MIYRFALLICFLTSVFRVSGVRADAFRPELALQTGHSRHILALAVSPNGSMIASAGYEKTVKIWDVYTGDVLHTIEEPDKDFVWNVVFSPDSSLLAMLVNNIEGTSDKVVLCSTRTGKIVHSWPQRTNSSSPLTFSPNSGLLAAGTARGDINLWNTQSGSLHKTLKGHSAASVALVYTEAGAGAGTKLLSLSTFDQTLREWDTANGDLLRTQKIVAESGARAALSFDGTVAAWGRKNYRDGAVTLCDTRTGGVLKVLPCKEAAAHHLAFSGDDKTLAVSSESGSSQLWSMPGGEFITTLENRENGAPAMPYPARTNAVKCAAFLPGSQGLVAGLGNGSLSFFELTPKLSPSWHRTLRGSNELMQSIEFSSDGRTLTNRFFSIPESAVKLRTWDTRSGALQKNNVRDIAARTPKGLSPDGQFRISRTRKAVRVVEAKSGKEVCALQDAAEAEKFVFLNGGKSVAGSIWKTVRVWDTASGAILWTSQEHKFNVSSLSVSPDGAFLVSTDYSGGVNIWSASGPTPQEQRAFSIGTAPQFVKEVQFAPDNFTFAVAAIDKVFVVDARQGQLIHTLEAHKGENYVAFSPDGRRIATCGDSTVKIWSAPSGRLLTTLYTLPADRIYASPNKSSQSKASQSKPNDGENTPNAYLALTPEGYYSGSAAADRFVRFRLGDALYPAESFQARYYRPDLVQKALAGDELPPVGPFKGPFPPIAKLGANLPDKFVGDSVTVNLAATDDSSIKNVAFFVNGSRVDAKPLTADSRPLSADSRALTADAKALTADAKALTADARPLTAESRSIPEAHKTLTRYTVQLPLPAGATSIKVQAIAFDDDDLQSPRDEILFTREAGIPSAGKLLGLCVGVSQYQDARLNLRFANADAKSLSEALNAQRGLYSEAKITALTDEKATAQSIKSALDDMIHSATRADTIFLALSGHGWRDDDRNFYFAPYEVNRNEVAKSALPWPAITSRLTQLSQRSKRVIVLLDACHSGSAATNEELVKAILSANAGVLVFASSRGNEVSLENADWGHGAFTKALLEAIGGKAAPPGESNITMLDFLSYVSRRVKALTQDQQHPQVPFLQDFDTDAAIVARP